ncbi:MAG: glycosyltransferase [Gammaproteobacteria bacterium]|nr:glycosyltransferase [Gammaproteobacteria bacterium]
MNLNPGRPLVVCQVVPALEGGGVERGTLELAQALVKQGHESIVVSGGGRLAKTLVRQGSRHFTLPIGRKSLATLRYVYPLRRILRTEGVNILHVRSRLPAWIARLAWKGMPANHRPHLVSTVHGLYSVSGYSAVMTRAERVIAVSETVREYLLANYPKLDPDLIQVIHRGVDTNAFPLGYQPTLDWLLGWYRRFPMLEGRPVILLPGRLSRIKGHDDFIQLMTRLQAAGSNAIGLVVGGYDASKQGYVDELQKSIQQRKLDNIVFAGQQDDMREIYATSDIVLSLSAKPESFGRTVIEALSIGTPVIGYDHGGVGETLRQAFPRGRILLGDIDELTGRVMEFLKHPPAIESPPPFTLQDMTDKTIRLYRELVG